MAATTLPRPPWYSAPGTKAYNNQPTCYTKRSMSLKLEKMIFITIIFIIMCTMHWQEQCGCSGRCPQPHMDRLWQFRCYSSVLWPYCHHPVAQFPWRQLERQSKYGQHGGDLGGLTMVDLVLSMCAFSPPDAFADSNASIPVPSMLLMRRCKGIGWEGVWEELFVCNRGCS